MMANETKLVMHGEEHKKYRCARDHADMEDGILVVEIVGVKMAICLRCYANMLRCCEAVPIEEPDETPDEKGAD